jgi:uncharacterized membrane protein YecN with MAPEG domain
MIAGNKNCLVCTGNFAEYLPPLVIVLSLLEMQSVFSPFYLHVFGASALASRLAHTLQLRAPETLPTVFRMVSARRLTSLLQQAYCANAHSATVLVWQRFRVHTTVLRRSGSCPRSP